MFFYLGGLVMIALVVLLRPVRWVPDTRVGIVERLGTYKRTLKPGNHLIIPIIERMRLVDTREQVISVTHESVFTHENGSVQYRAIIHYQITDPRAATYEIDDVEAELEKVAVTTLHYVLGGMDFLQTVSSREAINNTLRRTVSAATEAWGVRVTLTELAAVDPPS